MSYPGIKDLKLKEEVIFERSRKGRKAYSFPKENLENVENSLPKELLRENLELPELSEVDVVRHFTRLSTYNYSVDHGFYPLGSCTMKYNPKINEEIARIPEFANLHPETPETFSQGTLQMMYETQKMLAEIGGFAKTTLNPSAGAHGEYTGLGIIRTYFKEKGETKRKKIIIPDSAHGTNPASCTLNGFDVVVLKSNEFGKISLNELKEHLSEETAGLMLTIPNTLGVFETDILEITKMVHDAGGLVYGDGANMNALMGKTRPGDMGIDVMHFNLHKSFSTPHGGGGPGSGPVAVCEKLVDYLPAPLVEKDGEIYKFISPENTMGRIRSFYGNIGVVLKAYSYLLELGKENIAQVAENAVLNANYIKSQLKDFYHIQYPNDTLHEVVFDDSEMPNHVTTLDIAKSLIDRGYHPPTIYFPLIVHGALMVEPTETESKETIDEFIEAMKDIANEAKENSDFVKSAPNSTFISRPDETKAARFPILTNKMG